MAAWVRDPTLGAFAVRVLEKIAQQPADRAAVEAALSAVEIGELKPVVAADIARALSSLRIATKPAVTRNALRRLDYRPEPTTLEDQFHNAMLDIFYLAGEATRHPGVRGYWASYFLRGVRNKGGLKEGPGSARRLGNVAGLRAPEGGASARSVDGSGCASTRVRLRFSQAEELEIARDRAQGRRVQGVTAAPSDGKRRRTSHEDAEQADAGDADVLPSGTSATIVTPPRSWIGLGPVRSLRLGGSRLRSPPQSGRGSDP